MSRSPADLRIRGTIGRDDFVLSVDISADAGEVVAVVGRNGAGKSTLLHTVAGLVPLIEGRVVCGGDTWQDTTHDLFVVPEDRQCGVVFQDLRLFPSLNVRDNVAFGCRARGLSRTDARARADELLERVGVAHLGGRLPELLSGGERQRAALARALAPEPRVLLLDEPLTAVDASSRSALREFLAGAVGEFVGSVLIVSHDEADVSVLADRVVEIGGSS
ncbi:MAG: ATP-binding cassette domain-containing protein [Ilumatobacteraceae bacterium]